MAATGVHGPSRLALAKQALLALLLKLREEELCERSIVIVSWVR